MEINSRFCEVSTYAASSSGYNSSTASSSLNYIDDVGDSITVIDANNNINNKDSSECESTNCCDTTEPDIDSLGDLSDGQNQQTVTKLIITITLKKTEQVLNVGLSDLVFNYRGMKSVENDLKMLISESAVIRDDNRLSFSHGDFLTRLILVYFLTFNVLIFFKWFSSLL